MAVKKSNYQTKRVKFQGKDMTLYSLDGITWSTRPDELQTIIDRHSTEQAAFSSDLKGEEREKTAPVKPQRKFAKVHNDSEIDEVIEDDMAPDDLEEDVDLPEIPLDDEDDEKTSPKSSKQKAPEKKAPAKKISEPPQKKGKPQSKKAPKPKAKLQPKAKKPSKGKKKR